MSLAQTARVALRGPMVEALLVVWVSLGVTLTVTVAGLPTCSPTVVPVLNVCTGLCGTMSGQNGANQASAVAVAPNGDLVTVGYSTSYGASSFDVFVARLDGSTGSVIWARVWGSSGEDAGNAVAFAANGDVVLTGYTKGFGAGNSDVIVLRVNGTNGSIVWSRTYGGVGADSGNAVAVTPNGDVVVVGSSSSFGQGANDVLVIHLDGASGSVVSSRTWGGATSDVAVAVAVADNGDLLLAGYTGFGAGGVDVLALRLDTNGAIVWSRTWGGTNSDVASAMTVVGNDIVVTGYTQSFGTGGQDAIVLRLDATTGVVVWARCWGAVNGDYGTSVAVTPRGDVAVAGYTNGINGGVSGTMVLQVDGTNGSFVGTTMWGTSNNIWGYGVAATARGMVVVGSTTSFGGSVWYILPVFDIGPMLGPPALASTLTMTSRAGFVFSSLNVTTVLAAGNMTSPSALASAVTGALTLEVSAAVTASTTLLALKSNPAVPMVRCCELTPFSSYGTDSRLYYPH